MSMFEFVVYNAYPNAQMDALKNPNLSDTGNARAVLGFNNIVLIEADDVNDEYTNHPSRYKYAHSA